MGSCMGIYIIQFRYKYITADTNTLLQTRGTLETDILLHMFRYCYRYQQYMIPSGMDRGGSGQGQMADTCECGNEPSGPMKCGEILDWLKT